MRKLILSLFLVLALYIPAHAGMTQYFLGGYYNALSTDQTYYNAPMGGANWTTTEANVKILIPSAGTWHNHYIECTAVTGGDIAITGRLNESDQTLTATITDGNTTANDTVNSVSVARGEYISLKGVAASGRVERWSSQFDCTNDNEGFLSATSTDSPTANTTEYLPISGISTWSTATDLSKRQPAPKAFTAEKLIIKEVTAPGAGESRAYTLVEDGVDTGWGCSISDTNTSCEQTGTTESVASGAYLYWKCVSSTNAATTSNVYIAFVTDTGTNGESLLIGGTDNPTAISTTEFIHPTGSAQVWTASEDQRQRLMAFDTTFKDFYFYLTTAPGSTDTVDGLVRDDAATSDLSCQISAAGHSCTDSGSAAIVAQSKIAIGYTSTASTTSTVLWGLVQYNPVAGGALPQVIINTW